MSKHRIDTFGRKVWGPYPYFTSGVKRLLVNLSDAGVMSSMSYPRWLMECHLKRRLTSHETVDHIDNDATNNDITNLQLLSLPDNIRKSRKPISYIEFICPVCKVIATKRANYVRGNKKRGSAGPFCSRSCAGRFQYTK